MPIHVEENGWPTGPGRSEAEQAAALRAMVRAVNDFRGTYNVTDYRWFDLRDHNTVVAQLPAPLRPAASDYRASPPSAPTAG